MKFVARSRVAASPEQLYLWHMRPGAFQRLVPPWETVTMEGAQEPLSEGCLRRLRVSPLRIPWLARHDQFVEGRQFRDLQIRGPFSAWSHLHRFEPAPDGSWLHDEIDFQLPLGRLALPFLRRQLQRMFLYRHWSTARDLQLQSRYTSAPLRILVSGSSGQLGRHLVSFLRTAGHRVYRLMRRAVRHPDEVNLESSQLEALDCVIHLAGRGLLDGLWDQKHREDAYKSRVEGTSRLASRLAQLKHPPSTFLSASGVSYYGTAPASPLEEDAPAGDDFLAQLCVHWESAALPLQSRGTRCLQLRLGPVLTLEGGLLVPAYWTTFLSANFRLDDGLQSLPWIAPIDVVGAIYHLIHHPHCQGPVNLVAPHDSSLGELTACLSQQLGWRPQVTLSERRVRQLLGSRAELLPGRARVSSQRLQDWGYRFFHENLKDYLLEALGQFPPYRQPCDWHFQLDPR